MRRFFHQGKIYGPFLCALVLAVIISVIHARLLYWDARSGSMQISMRSSVSDKAQLFYDSGGGFSERESVTSNVVGDFQFHTHEFALPRKTIYNLRFDPPAGVVSIQRISVVNGFGKSLASIDLHALSPENHIRAFDFKNNTLNVTVEEGANDPQIRIPLSSPLKLDTFLYFTALPFVGRLLGGFLFFSLSIIFLIQILKKRGALTGFCDHPVKASCGWLMENRLFFSVILCTLAFRVFFALTYPFDTCSDQGMYYRLMRHGESTLIYATGYPYLMHFFSAFLPTKGDILVFQHIIDFSVQLALMILLKKRFGLVAAVTAGLFYGLELRTINWISRSTPEWLQGVFFALAFVGAIEAYLAEKSAKKIILYLFSAWAFALTVLVKFLTVVLLPVYPILFILERKKWRGKWVCIAAMGIVFFAQIFLFIELYHYPSTGSKALTGITGWTLHRKMSFFLPEGHHLSESGPWSKRYCILISEMPDPGNIDVQGLFRRNDSVPQAIRKPYRERYRELSAKSDSELQSIIHTKQNLKGIGPEFWLAYYYLGLSETNSLLTKAFFESVIHYPKEYFLHVVEGIKEAFFIQTSYNIAIIFNSSSSDPDHPFQLNKDDIVRDLGWGYALYNAPPGYIRCMYDEPIFLKSGLHFFSSWGEWVKIPIIIKWLFIFLGTILAYMGYRKDKRFKPYILYLSLGVLVLFLLIVLSNLIFGFRDKEFEVCQHLLSVVLGISVSSIIAFRKLKS